MTRTDSDFPYYGDAECDALARIVEAIPRTDEFSVRPGSRYDEDSDNEVADPRYVTLCIRRSISGRLAGFEMKVARTMLGAVTAKEMTSYLDRIIEHSFSKLAEDATAA